MTLVANWIPFEEPAGGPNFYQFATDAHYDINIDNNGDSKPDITYRWTFATKTRSPHTFLYNTGPVTSLNDPDLNIRQAYRLDVFSQGRWHPAGTALPVAPSYVGKALMPNYGSLRNQAIVKAGSLTSFAGQADDPFFLDLRVFDLLYGGNLSEVGSDTLAGYNVNTVALQVPIKHVTSGNDPVIGVWTTTSRRGADGKYHQVSRLGMPLVNEVVIPLAQKDRFNASTPWHDAQFLTNVTNPELPKLIQAVYGIKAPKTPRQDLAQVFLTGVPKLNQPAHVRPSEMLRLNTSTPVAAKPDRLGVIGGDVAGFPNGRRLADDVVDASLQVVEGELVGSPNNLGDAVSANDSAFGTAFPYVALPHSGSVPRPAAAKSGVTPLTGGNVADRPTSGPRGDASAAGLALAGTALAGTGVLLAVGGALAARAARRRNRSAAA